MLEQYPSFKYNAYLGRKLLRVTVPEVLWVSIALPSLNVYPGTRCHLKIYCFNNVYQSLLANMILLTVDIH